VLQEHANLPPALMFLVSCFLARTGLLRSKARCSTHGGATTGVRVDQPHDRATDAICDNFNDRDANGLRVKHGLRPSSMGQVGRRPWSWTCGWQSNPWTNPVASEPFPSDLFNWIIASSRQTVLRDETIVAPVTGPAPPWATAPRNPQRVATSSRIRDAARRTNRRSANRARAIARSCEPAWRSARRRRPRCGKET